MDYYLKIKDDKVIAKFSEILKNLSEGDFYIHIEKIPENKPEKQYRAQFFAKMTELSFHTGHTKQELHEMFKIDNNISTTKNLSIEEWSHTINKLNWWAFNKLEYLL